MHQNNKWFLSRTKKCSNPLYEKFLNCCTWKPISFDIWISKAFSYKGIQIVTHNKNLLFMMVWFIFKNISYNNFMDITTIFIEHKLYKAANYTRLITSNHLSSIALLLILFSWIDGWVDTLVITPTSLKVVPRVPIILKASVAIILSIVVSIVLIHILHSTSSLHVRPRILVIIVYFIYKLKY